MERTASQGQAKAVNVAIRCRVVLPHDRDQRVCVRAVSNREIECLDPEHLHTELREKNGHYDYLKENHNRERAYTFDAVFGPTATNQMLFEQLALPLIPEVLNGKHATCFAYGQTGSGKTHTMLGRQGEAGLVERALQELLEQAGRQKATTVVTFVEVYNEKIRDLLSPKTPFLDLREDPLRGPCMIGVSEVPAASAEEVMELVREGNGRRTEETTAANPVSSRSHAVLQLHVETPLPAGPGVNAAAALRGGKRKKRSAKFALIDLAGSERAANTGNRGARLREGAAINRSLLALANCITALTRKGAYVNYRDSKLTRLLKDSLSGNCFTTMIAHVSPSIASFEETLNTLKYAHRACEIRGMCGGVRENICEVAVECADRLRPCMEATRGLKDALAKLAAPKPPPSRRQSSNASAPPSKAVALAEELEKTRHKVVGKMRDRVRIEQTALELDEQNQVNAIELAKLEVDAMMGASAEAVGRQPLITPKGSSGGVATSLSSGTLAEPQDQQKLLNMHGALRAATRKNALQRQQVEQACVKAAASPAAEAEGQQRLVSLLTTAKKIAEGEGEPVSEVEKRLLNAQHQLALLEIERVEAEQAKVLVEAAARQHELAVKKQQFQLDLHSRALSIAEKLFSQHGLREVWREALGPLAKLLSSHQQAEAEDVPSLDDLIAEVSAPVSPAGSRPPTSLAVASPSGSHHGVGVGGLAAGAAGVSSPSGDGAAAVLSEADNLRAIDEEFNDMRVTLSRSNKLAAVSALDVAAESSESDIEVPVALGSDDEDDEEAEASPAGAAVLKHAEGRAVSKDPKEGGAGAVGAADEGPAAEADAGGPLTGRSSADSGGYPGG